MSDSLRPHGLQHTRLPCPSPSPRVYANSCPLSRRCHHNHLILCHLLLLTSILPSTGVFSNESDAMWYGQKKRKTTQRIPSTFFREKKRERLYQQEAKTSWFPHSMLKKSLSQPTARLLGGETDWHPPRASNGFPNPSVLASFLPSAIMHFLPQHSPQSSPQ